VTVRILCRAAGRDDIVLTLTPGHYERISFERGDGAWVYPPDVGILLLEDDSGDVAPAGIHIDQQRPVTVEQGALTIGQAGLLHPDEGLTRA
jgi:hypothetical protein